MPGLNFYIPFPRELLTYPGARTQRTTFPEKLKDTFYAFFGKTPRYRPGYGEKPGRLGIFDYLTLGIPRGLKWAFFGMSEFLPKLGLIGMVLSYVPRALGKVVEYVSLAARYITAIAATVVFSPIVLITHLVASVVGYDKYTSALAIQGRDQQNLESYLETNHMSLDDVRLTNINALQTDSYRKITLEFNDKRPQPNEASPRPTPFVVEIQQAILMGRSPIPLQKYNLEALMKLNLFKAHSRINEGASHKFTVGAGEGYTRQHEKDVSDWIKDTVLPSRQ